MKLLQYLKQNLAFDIRALALMRIAVGAVVLIDLSIRISDLEAFYANTGTSPLAMIFQYKWNDFYWSFHTMSGLWQFQLLLFVLAAFCALMLLIGYRTQLFTFCSWLLLISLHNRNPLILQGGDDLLRMLLFWGLFLPWGKRYSYDSSQIQSSYNAHVETTIFTFGTLAYILQITYLYTGSALLKGPEWHTNFEALYYVYSLDQIAYAQTQLLYYYPASLKVLTGIAFWFELLVPVLFFIPFKSYMWRSTAFLLIVGFHTFNSLNLLIGLFPLIGIVSAIGILPSQAMTWIEEHFIKIKKQARQSFLGIASLCKNFIAWKPDLKTNFLSNIILVFATLYVFAWNAGNLSFNPYKLADEIRFVGHLFRLDQNWGMFAPGVFKDDGWYVMEGTTKDHRKIDLFHPDDSLTYKKPANITAMYKNDRWRKYSENLIFVSNDFMRGYFCNYYIRKWNKEHPDKLVTHLSIIYFTELTAPDYHYVIPKKDVLCSCYN